MNWIQQFKQRIEQENPQPEGQGESLDPAALRTVDDFLLASYEVSDGVLTPADNIYAAYQVWGESRQVGTVNATAFSVRVMNFYRGRGVQRDEVITDDGKRIAIDRGLAPKPQTEPPPAATVSERLPVVRHRTPTEPVPIEASDPHPERDPGEDEAGISGEWPPKQWSLAEWVKGAQGDFHVFYGLWGAKPISRGFSWKD